MFAGLGLSSCVDNTNSSNPNASDTTAEDS